MGVKNMVSGHIAIKKGYYYCVLNWKDDDGKRHSKWIATGLTFQNNKRKAEAKLAELKASFKPPVKEKQEAEDPYFSDFLRKEWLPSKKNKVQETTFSGYTQRVERIIAPYFDAKKIRLSELTVRDIQQFYDYEAKAKKGSTVLQYHAVIHNALEYAVRMEYIPYNVADRCEKPTKERPIINPYTKEELARLLSCVGEDSFGILVKIAILYGFRRSEILGLKWSSIDLESGTITACHAVTEVKKDGKMELFKKDEMKNSSSFRTLPMVGSIEADLKKLKEQQDHYRELCGDCYFEGDSEYIFVDKMGHLFRPDYVSDHFQVILRQNHLRKIRFHDLRHSCATLLVRHGASMKQVQDWLGHSDYGTTANMYTHLGDDSKKDTARVISKELGLDSSNNEENQEKKKDLERTQERTGPEIE